MALYEEQGPDANYVRDYMYKKVHKQYSVLPDPYINRVLLTHIPNALQTFGSWRGWGTFGMPTHIGKAIVSELDSGLQALNKIKQLLYLQHYLYKPGSTRAKNIQNNSSIGKPQV